MTERSTAHATVTIERDDPGTPARVVAAWTRLPGRLEAASSGRLQAAE